MEIKTSKDILELKNIINFNCCGDLNRVELKSFNNKRWVALDDINTFLENKKKELKPLYKSKSVSVSPTLIIKTIAELQSCLNEKVKEDGK